MIKRWFNRLGLWLVRITEEVIELPELVLSPLEIRAKELCLQVEVTSALGTSGEYKRHQVLARLFKEFPDENKRVISMVIERMLP